MNERSCSELRELSAISGVRTGDASARGHACALRPCHRDIAWRDRSPSLRTFRPTTTASRRRCVKSVSYRNQSVSTSKAGARGIARLCGPPPLAFGELRRDIAPSLARSASEGWRRGRDSNPWYPSGYSGFQDRRHRPLGHPSASDAVPFLEHAPYRPLYVEVRGPCVSCLTNFGIRIVRGHLSYNVDHGRTEQPC